MTRNYRVDALRLLAAFLVILIHVSAKYWLTYPITDPHWNAVNFYDSLARPAVPLFLMISGMFLLRPEKKIDGKTLWQKYIRRVLILFVFWAAFYASFRDILYPILSGQKIVFKNVLTTFFQGNYHLWYLVMLFGIYLILPFLKKIAEDKKLLEYFLLLTLVITVILPMIKSPYIKEFVGNMYFSFTLGFTGYFMLGYYLTRYPLKDWVRRLLYLGGIAGFLFTYFGTAMWSESLGYPADCYNPFLPNIVLLSTGIFVFFAKDTGKHSEWCAKWIPKLASTTLGIYLIHPFFLAVFDVLHLMPASVNLSFFITFPLFAGILYTISMISIFFLKKIPLIGKYLL